MYPEILILRSDSDHQTFSNRAMFIGRSPVQNPFQCPWPHSRVFPVTKPVVKGWRGRSLPGLWKEGSSPFEAEASPGTCLVWRWASSEVVDVEAFASISWSYTKISHWRFTCGDGDSWWFFSFWERTFLEVNKLVHEDSPSPQKPAWPRGRGGKTSGWDSVISTVNPLWARRIL
jgi:hypothetical protein